MNRASTLTQADITRAIKAAQAAGLTVFEVAATKQGVRIVTSEPADRTTGAAQNPWDGLLGHGQT